MSEANFLTLQIVSLEHGALPTLFWVSVSPDLRLLDEAWFVADKMNPKMEFGFTNPNMIYFHRLIQ